MTTVYTINNISLITLQGSPAKIDFISEVFDRLSEHGVNVDMISMAATHADKTELSFTVFDDDLVEVLTLVAKLKTELGVHAIVSSANYKVSIHDTAMKNTPGIAAKLFNAIKSTNADIRLISTSEVEISLLLSEADYDTVTKAITIAFEE